MHQTDASFGESQLPFGVRVYKWFTVVAFSTNWEKKESESGCFRTRQEFLETVLPAFDRFSPFSATLSVSVSFSFTLPANSS